MRRGLVISGYESPKGYQSFFFVIKRDLPFFDRRLVGDIFSLEIDLSFLIKADSDGCRARTGVPRV